MLVWETTPNLQIQQQTGPLKSNTLSQFSVEQEARFL
jgi:hypothetical protein